jgi:predicted AAA+ superfamily ATPase
MVQRDYNIPINSGKIISLIGARRSGKTFLLYQLMANLPLQRLIFINFEDERLELQADELDLILQAQVCYQLDDSETKKREIKGLLQACKYFGLQQGKIITYDSYDSFNLEGISIELVPIVEFLS